LLRKQQKTLGGYFILPHLVYVNQLISHAATFVAMWLTERMADRRQSVLGPKTVDQTYAQIGQINLTRPRKFTVFGQPFPFWWLHSVTNSVSVGLVNVRRWVRLPAVPLPGNNPGQVVHTRASVTKQYNLVPA